MLGGTRTTCRPDGRPGRVPGVVPGVGPRPGPCAGRPAGGAPAPEFDEPLHPAVNARHSSATAIAPRKGLQAGIHPVDSMAMGATQLYPAVPDDSRRPDLEARVA